MSETTTDAPAAGHTSGDPAPDPASPSPAEPTGQQADQRGQWSVENLPEGAQKLIRDLRKEAGDKRSEAKTATERAAAERQEMLDGIARALGLKQDDTPPDPAALQQAVTERETRIGSLETRVREQDVELAAWRAATAAGADVVGLLDSRKFVGDIAKLDPTAEDFSAHLDAAVRAAMQANPALRGQRLPSAGAAGIGAVDSSRRAEATPGMSRVKTAYATSQQ